MTHLTRACLLAVMGGLAVSRAPAQTVDTLVFGNVASETSHSLTSYFPPPTDIAKVPWEKQVSAPCEPSFTPPSEITTGALGQTARHLLPRTPCGDVYGGQMSFSMAVDPTAQNYFTIKLWGSEPDGGNLLLNCNGKEIGNRHGGGGLNEDPLYFAGPGWFPERFIYRTEPLPLSMTYRKTSVTITIRSLGGMFDYAPIFTYVPQYQHLMNSPSPSIYAAYTHAGSIADISGETQGTAPQVQTPRIEENDAAELIRARANVNERLAALLGKSAAAVPQGDVFFLAECYDAKTKCGAKWIEYPAGKTEADLGKQITAALDALVMKYAVTPEVATGGWGGELGEMGNAIRLSWPLLSDAMPAQIDFGGSIATSPRRAAWSSALRASVDAGRLHRQNIANQALCNATNIYLANRGLLLVDPANALKETEALRYIKEACGILPWLGDDEPGDGPVPTRGPGPYGPNWYMCTTKGTSKDGNGFVGSDYGEIGSWIYKLGLWSGDAQILARGVTMTRSRDYFRFPGTDEKGYLIMQGTDPIGIRNNDLPGHYVYLGRGFADDFLMASQGAGVIGKDLVGYFQEGINDGQMARNIWNDPYLPDQYTAIKAMPQTNIKLPMAIGQPDFAWIDEENMVVAAKHGEERFFANLFWRQPGFINGLAKVFHLTPTIAHLGDVMIDDIRFRSSGETRITRTDVDTFEAPPDHPVAAYGKLPGLVALRSDLASLPAENRDGGRGTGYTFRYGHWLVGINADYAATYTLPLPAGVPSATDLISGTVKTSAVILAPKTSAVFYLPDAVTKSPLPSRTLYIAAAAGNHHASIFWNPAGGAASYTVLRGNASGGPYATVATGVTDCAYADETAPNGQACYYVVVSVNATGSSGYSPEASATPVAPHTPTLAVPWGDVDFGGSGGTATVSPLGISVTSGSGAARTNGDSCHFLYQTLAGDGMITTQIQSESSTQDVAQAGLMIRSSLDPDAAEVSLFAANGHQGASFLHRARKGDDTTGEISELVLPQPSWVRLMRSGDIFTGYVSPDGKTWSQIGSCTMPDIPLVAYAGLATAPGTSGTHEANTVSYGRTTLQLSASAPPSPPTMVTGAGGNASGSLNWSGDGGAAKFNLKRAASASGPFTTVAAGLADSSYTDYGLQNGTTYYYVVSSVNVLGESANSSVVSLQPTQLPGAVAGLSAKGASGQVTLSWTAQLGATSYLVRRADGPLKIFLPVASQLTQPTFTDTGLKDGTLYHYQVSAMNGGGEGAISVLNVLPPSGVPDEWMTRDIGPAVAGASSWTDGKFTILGGGAEIGKTSDAFRYIYQTIKGDCKITARVTEIQNTSPWAKAGLMIRNTLDPGSAFASVYVTPGNGVSSQYRSAIGANAAIQKTDAGLTSPYGVRIIRKGSTFSYFRSDDGATWTPMGTTTIPMNEEVYLGLAVCSLTENTLGKSAIDHVTVAPLPPDQ